MKKLAIIGASYLQLPLVKYANKMGHHTICFAWEEGAVCREFCNEFYPISITEKEKILEVCKRLNIDGVTSIASDVAVPTMNFVAAELNLTGNSIESGILSTNKFLMRKSFFKNKVRVPKFIEVDKNFDVNTIINISYPLIIKPLDRSGSKGITVLKSPYGLKSAITYALEVSFIQKAIIEEFIVGEEISVEGISYKGEHHIITFTDKVTSGFPHFVELEHHQPSKYINSTIKDKIIENVVKGLNSLQISNGASHSELIITKDAKVYLTEIGARMGGDFIGSDLVQLSTGYDYLKSVIDIALGKFNNQHNSTENFAGVYFYSTKSKNIKEACQKYNDEIVAFDFDDVLKNELKQSADRSGYFIYQSNSKLIVI